MSRRPEGLWHNARGVGLGTAGFLLAFFLVHLPHGPEHWSADLRTAWLADQLDGQHPRIALVLLDEESLRDKTYLVPYDRGILASIVKKLIDAEAAAIGLDVIFDRPTESEKDRELIETLKDPRVKIVLGTVDESSKDEGTDFQRRLVRETGRPVGHLFYGEHHNPVMISDQVVREMADPAYLPKRVSFAELIARAAGWNGTIRSLYISWLRTPKNGRDTFLTLTADDILGRGLAEPLPLKEMLRNKLVLIGGNFQDRDQHLIPFSVLRGQRYPGVTIHAQILAQLLDTSRRPVHLLGWPIWLILVLASIGCGYFAGHSKRLSSLRPWTEVSTVFLLIALSILAFLFGRFIFPFVSVVLGWGWGEMLGHSARHLGVTESGDHDVAV